MFFPSWLTGRAAVACSCPGQPRTEGPPQTSLRPPAGRSRWPEVGSDGKGAGGRSVPTRRRRHQLRPLEEKQSSRWITGIFSVDPDAKRQRENSSSATGET